MPFIVKIGVVDNMHDPIYMTNVEEINFDFANHFLQFVGTDGVTETVVPRERIMYYQKSPQVNNVDKEEIVDGA